jgi:hypothetical protein
VSRYGVSISIEADSDCARPERAPSQMFVKNKSLNRHQRKSELGSYQRYVAIQLGKTFCERLNSNKTTTTTVDILRNGCYEIQPTGARVAAQGGTAGRS